MLLDPRFEDDYLDSIYRAIFTFYIKDQDALGNGVLKKYIMVNIVKIMTGKDCRIKIVMYGYKTPMYNYRQLPDRNVNALLTMNSSSRSSSSSSSSENKNRKRRSTAMNKANLGGGSGSERKKTNELSKWDRDTYARRIQNIWKSATNSPRFQHSYQRFIMDYYLAVTNSDNNPYCGLHFHSRRHQETHRGGSFSPLPSFEPLKSCQSKLTKYLALRYND